MMEISGGILKGLTGKETIKSLSKKPIVILEKFSLV